MNLPRFCIAFPTRVLMVAMLASAMLAIGAPVLGKSPSVELAGETKLTENVRLRIYTLTHEAGYQQDVWIYTPFPHPAGPIPLVIIPPAGGNMLTAAVLAEDSIPEHIPYVEAGFAVVSTSLQGPIPEESASDEVFFMAIIDFEESKAGVVDCVAALDVAFSKIPDVDRKRVYAAGHSSAGTLALVLASYEARIKAVVSYASAWDVEERIGREVIDDLNEGIETYATFVAAHSPVRRAGELSVPILHFHADDDQVVDIGEAKRSIKKARGQGANIVFRNVATGGHYDSMIEQGIPMGIEWLQKLK